MQNQNLKLNLLFLGIIFSAVFGATKNASASIAFYVDPTAGSGGNGTYASPWNSLAQINGHSFSSGDDVYFKAGTTMNVPAGQYLDIKWNGTSGDWVTIGAYYGDGLFGLNGGARPILDGLNAAPTTESYRGLIDKQNGNYTDAYVEVKDLRINNSGEAGIVFMYVNYAKITNCYTYRDRRGNGIQAGRSNNVIIDGNTVNGSAWGLPSLGGGICIASSWIPGSSQNCQVINNTVFNVHGEGIDIIGGGENILVSGNTIYDNLSVFIYVDSSRYVEVTNNIMYKSATNPWAEWRQVPGVAIDNEAAQGLCYARNVDIHNNYIANMDWGFSFGSQITESCTVDNVNFYNNILVDSEYDNTSVSKGVNYMIWTPTTGWTNNNIFYNISYTSNNATMEHSSYYSPPGITWGANIFDDAVSGNAGDQACTVAAPLLKTSGWNNLTAGSVTASDFDLSSAGLAGRTACFGGDTTAPGAPSGLAVE